MALFFGTIPIMVVMVVLAVLPGVIVLVREPRVGLVTPEQIVATAASVRSGPELESEPIRRAKEAAAARLAEVTPGDAGREQEIVRAA